MGEKKFEITSQSPAGQEKKFELVPDSLIVIDNGKFRISISKQKIEKALAEKNITPEKQRQVWDGIIDFKNEVDGVNKEEIHIGSTDPLGAMSAEIFKALGENPFSDDELCKLFIETQKS